MDRQKSRKGQETKKMAMNSLDISTNSKSPVLNDKNKYKKPSYYTKKKYENSPSSYFTNYPAQARLHPFGQRSFSTPDSSICHYPVPLSVSFEPVSLPIYSALIQPQGNCVVPLEIENHRLRSYHKNRKNKVTSDEVPAMFNTPRLNTGDQQDYTSLPPVNCDVYAPKSNDIDVSCKRRFSDPGIGQMSSDECSTRSDSSKSSGTVEEDSPDFFAVIQQLNDLKESNSNLQKELQEMKLELETLKTDSPALRSDSFEFKPGTLSDAISEIRNAVKLGEEALISKVMQMLEKNKMECKEVQKKLEVKLRQEIESNAERLEAQWANKTARKNDGPETAAPEACNGLPNKPEDLTMQQQLVELEQEKLQLRKELQEAVAKRKTAEATTEKLERLVGVLRKKINGVSLESSMPEEKPAAVPRPLASSFEKNPFIIANNRQGQKLEPLAVQKPKNPPFKAFAPENPDAGALGASENKENETVEVGGESPGNALAPGQQQQQQQHHHQQAPVTAQVTITGPVTDL